MKHTENDKKLFSKPLILGASISAGYGTRDGGPGSVLALLINPETKITNVAVSGATSVQSTAHLNLSQFNPSIVLGFDLFFWDAAREQTGARFESNTRKLFQHFHEYEIPMIIGKVPVIDLPFGLKSQGIKRSALKVNALLEELSQAKTNVLLYDPIDCFMAMDSDTYFSDNLHLTREGNKFCAQFLVKSEIYRKLEARAL